MRVNKIKINEYWTATKCGPRNYIAKRNDGEVRFYFSREAIERDFGALVFDCEMVSATTETE